MLELRNSCTDLYLFLLILSSGFFFKDILQRNKHPHPLIYLKGVLYSELVSILNFMYHGQVNVEQDQLNSFLATAEELKVKGLTKQQSVRTGIEETNLDRRKRTESQQPPPLKRARLSLKEPREEGGVEDGGGGQGGVEHGEKEDGVTVWGGNEEVRVKLEAAGAGHVIIPQAGVQGEEISAEVQASPRRDADTPGAHHVSHSLIFSVFSNMTNKRKTDGGAWWLWEFSDYRIM